MSTTPFQLPTSGCDQNSCQILLTNTYKSLPHTLYQTATAARFPSPELIIFNHQLAGQLGVDTSHFQPEHIARFCTGQNLIPGSEPIAQAYAGHQYGGFTMLGDGRAMLLGEFVTTNGDRIDIHLKGSGQTPFSRRGDGRAALGPMLREYIISEAMHHLGIPCTRSLAVATTGETVYRDRTLHGAVLTRLASSHIRIGTFQYLAAKRDYESLKQLADYTISRHYADISDHQDKYLAFIHAVSERQAKLIALWQGVGFIHGVMNTDNASVAGETLDFGPCAFMDTYDPNTVFSSIDLHGRYSYQNQPKVAQWNLIRFIESLLPLISEHQDKAITAATQIIDTLPALFHLHWLNHMRQKIGLLTPRSDDETLIQDLLTVMQQLGLDYTHTFRALGDVNRLEILKRQDHRIKQWLERWESCLARDGLNPELIKENVNQVNPTVIPRNHLVEDALKAAVEDANLSPTKELLTVIAQPFNNVPEQYDRYLIPPKRSEQLCYRTFCGT